MWSTIGSVASYATGIATGVANATYTGIMGTGEKMPYDCAYPFQPVTRDLSDAAELSQRHFEQASELLDAKDWEPMGISDPEGGDMKAMTRAQIGTFHFVKVQFSVMNVEPMAVASVVRSEELAARKKYSADLCELTPLARSGSMVLLHIGYGVPPPVACRDMVFLTNMAQDEDSETVHVWGCSVDSDLCREGWNGNVRGSSLWMWRFAQVGPHTLATYFTTFDPRGWTPPFLVAWLKSQAQSEFLALRSIMSGKEAKLHNVSFSDIGLSAEQVAAAQAEHEAETKPAAAA